MGFLRESGFGFQVHLGRHKHGLVRVIKAHILLHRSSRPI